MTEELGPGWLTPTVGAPSEPRYWTYPQWPTWEPEEEPESLEKIFPLSSREKPVPEDPMEVPWKLRERRGLEPQCGLA